MEELSPTTQASDLEKSRSTAMPSGTTPSTAMPSGRDSKAAVAVDAVELSYEQVTRSMAVSTTSSQAAFSSQPRQGRLPNPLALASRIRSSTRAC